MSYKRMLLRPAVQNLFIECNLACLHEILLETVSYHLAGLTSHRLTHGLIGQHPFHRIIERIRISRHTHSVMVRHIPTRRFSTAGSIGLSPTRNLTKPSSKPPTAKTSGSTSPAEPTRAKTATRSSTSCRRSNPQWFQIQPSRSTIGRAFSIAIANTVIVSISDPAPL